MNKVIVLTGIVGSGKSTYANNLKYNLEDNSFEEVYILSSDSMRKELFGDENSQEDNQKVFDALYLKAIQLLKANDNIAIILDSTNLSSKKRKYLIDMIKGRVKKGITFESKIIATPYNDCIKNNKNRERNVPNHVIKKMRESFQIPQYYEGFNSIEIIYNDNYEYNDDCFNCCIDFNQHNKNHSLTIDNHLKIVESILSQEYPEDNNLSLAGGLHDIGKPYTFSFKDSKDMYSSNAHFYNHENVGCYEAMLLLNDIMSNDNIVDICGLINNHMRPHIMKEQKTIDKFIKLVGQEYYDRLIKLHQADMLAR